METQNNEVIDDGEDKFILLCRELSLGGLAGQAEDRRIVLASLAGRQTGIYEIFDRARPDTDLPENLN